MFGWVIKHYNQAPHVTVSFNQPSHMQALKISSNIVFMRAQHRFVKWMSYILRVLKQEKPSNRCCAWCSPSPIKPVLVATTWTSLLCTWEAGAKVLAVVLVLKVVPSHKFMLFQGVAFTWSHHLCELWTFSGLLVKLEVGFFQPTFALLKHRGLAQVDPEFSVE